MSLAGRVRWALRWRALRAADRVGLDLVSTVRSGPGAGLRIGSARSSADYRDGRNERPVQDQVVAALSPGGSFIDVGANVGFFSLLAARVVGEHGSVLALEPSPPVAAALRRNVDRNGFEQVTVLEVAASDRSGVGDLGLSRHPGGSSLRRSGSPPDVTGHIEVPITTLDELVGDGTPPPDLVKVDTETGELDVLRGAAETLRRHRPVVLVELDAREDTELAGKVREITDHLRSVGYEVSELPSSYPNTSWKVVHLVAHPR